MLRRMMTCPPIRCIMRQRYKKSVAGRARGDMNPPRASAGGFAFFSEPGLMASAIAYYFPALGIASKSIQNIYIWHHKRKADGRGAD